MLIEDRLGNRLDACIARGKAYGPYTDLLWMETSTRRTSLMRHNTA